MATIYKYIYDGKKIRKRTDKIDFNIKKMKLDSVGDIEDKAPKLQNKIEDRNIIRSKIECQRLAKANMREWQTFITLTFAENITDIEIANKQFRNYIDKVKRVFKDFKYLCVPEFQKRGAVHYHILSNIKINSELIPKRPLKKLYNPSSKEWNELEYYNLKYWQNGFSSAEPIVRDEKKVIGYISKYMTKDIDDRLFSRHRYFFSRNLKRPSESYLDLNNEKDKNLYKKIIQENNLVYQNEYINPYDNGKVTFLELNKLG